jgi:hypothetical protein|tara:strand:- start:626 stop:1420 length:795 start_codon:yes stop_codon:yes gene_type:complete
MYKTDIVNRKKALDILQVALTIDQFNNIGRLEQEVYPLVEPINITHPFHGVHHTRDDVVPNAVILGHAAGLPFDKLYVLTAAAILHDVGHVKEYLGHEDASIDFAKTFLPDYGFTEDEIRKSQQIIEATRMVVDKEERLRQSPDQYDPLQKLMCDADLGNLGAHFLSAGLALLGEHYIQLGEGNIPEDYTLPEDEYDFLTRQLKFITDHEYFTQEAEELFGEGKKENIDIVDSFMTYMESNRRRNRTLDKLLALPDWVPSDLIA